MMVKKEFDRQLTAQELDHAKTILDEAFIDDVTRIINVGTSLIESTNCVNLAKKYTPIFASVGIHPNDCTSTWRKDLEAIHALIKHKTENKIVAIGECGLDFHYPDYDKQRQKDAFKAQIELALEYDLALIVHTRQAPDETIYALEEFKGQITRGVIHCFSEDLPFAKHVIALGFVIGIGGTITYPKNDTLRTVCSTVPLEAMVLETDAPFLPPQVMRGKQNHPRQIATVAQFLADLRNISFDEVAQKTTHIATRLFQLP